MWAACVVVGGVVAVAVVVAFPVFAVLVVVPAPVPVPVPVVLSLLLKILIMIAITAVAAMTVTAVLVTMLMVFGRLLVCTERVANMIDDVDVDVDAVRIFDVMLIVTPALAMMMLAMSTMTAIL